MHTSTFNLNQITMSGALSSLMSTAVLKLGDSISENKFIQLGVFHFKFLKCSYTIHKINFRYILAAGKSLDKSLVKVQ